jgi:hypothetical protein
MNKYFIFGCCLISVFIIGLSIGLNLHGTRDSLYPQISSNWLNAPEETEVVAYMAIDGSGDVFPFRCFRLGEFAFDVLPSPTHAERPLYGRVIYWHLFPVVP